MPENQNLHLIWIGPPTADDPKAVTLAQEIQKQVAALPSDLQSRVHFPGAVTDSYRLLKAFDLFALPTYSECFALSLLEAQLAGLPSLATNSGGSPAVVREGETGWLFEPRSESAASSALARAIEQKLLWKRFGEAAERQVRDGYDFAQVLPGTVSAYRELLASAGPRTLATDL
jgi:glycosyltransferase involved in cell wall biosynthesis